MTHTQKSYCQPTWNISEICPQNGQISQNRQSAKPGNKALNSEWESHSSATLMVMPSPAEHTIPADEAKESHSKLCIVLDELCAVDTDKLQSLTETYP